MGKKKVGTEAQCRGKKERLSVWKEKGRDRDSVCGKKKVEI